MVISYNLHLPYFKVKLLWICMLQQHSIYFQILSVLEAMERSLPKVHRSASEPTLNPSNSEDLDMFYVCASPKTPINSQFQHFIFSSSGGLFWCSRGGRSLREISLASGRETFTLTTCDLIWRLSERIASCWIFRVYRTKSPPVKFQLEIGSAI